MAACQEVFWFAFVSSVFSETNGGHEGKCHNWCPADGYETIQSSQKFESECFEMGNFLVRGLW